uniref:Protein kinase domain-containing protein n=1 Tax=Syphacia muris TaxID=451379 RepID=A0A0N5AUU2_9BILA
MSHFLSAPSKAYSFKVTEEQNESALLVDANDTGNLMDNDDADSCELTQKDTQYSKALAQQLKFFASYFQQRSIVEEETKRRKYATLEPMDERLNPIGIFLKQDDNGLYAEYFELGRKPKLRDYCDFHELTTTVKTYMSISERHCYIQRDFDDDVTYLVDESQFGTYVNSQLLGKGKRCKLNNMDIISLGDAENFVYMYLECASVKSTEFPAELSKRYYVSNHVLGVGAMGTVYLGKRRLNHQLDKVAVKAIRKKKYSFLICDDTLGTSTGDSAAVSAMIKREVDIMLKIHHPNCVNLEYMCESSEFAYLVMEYVEGGELFSRIVDEENHGKGLGEDLSKFYVYQLLKAVEYLHSCKVVHRDIKPENILLLKKDAYTVVKLSDFGLSKARLTKLQTFCGTQCYMAPELFKQEPEYNCLVDVWALGAVLFVCLVGYPPFSPDYPDMPLKEQICKGRLIFLRVWKKISHDAQELVRSMLRVDTRERITVNGALKHAWFKDPIVDYANRIVKSYAVRFC